MPKFVNAAKALHLWSALAQVSTMVVVLTFSCSGLAQQALYPLKEGIVQPVHNSDIPSWLTLDMELRGRTEEQTSLGYVSGKDRLYELTRVWGGMTVVPVNWLTFYAHFMDLHALGLPLKDTAANMRDTFDLRQGYLDFHYKPVQLVVGRQELRIGDERVVGISDWTNTSRTWDGVYMRLGNVNQVNLFSTSVVTIHPTSMDTHGAGLTFDGVHAKLATYVPRSDIEPFVLVRALPRVTSQQGVVGSESEATFGSYYETKRRWGLIRQVPVICNAAATATIRSMRARRLSVEAMGQNACRGSRTWGRSMTTRPAIHIRMRIASAPTISSIQATTMHSAWWTCSASRTSSSVA